MTGLPTPQPCFLDQLIFK